MYYIDLFNYCNIIVKYLTVLIVLCTDSALSCTTKEPLFFDLASDQAKTTTVKANSYIIDFKACLARICNIIW